MVLLHYKIGVVLTLPLGSDEEACVNVAKPFVDLLREFNPGATMERHIGYWNGEAEAALWLYTMLDDDDPALRLRLYDALLEWGIDNDQEAVAMIEGDYLRVVSLDLVSLTRA